MGGGYDAPHLKQIFVYHRQDYLFLDKIKHNTYPKCLDIDHKFMVYIYISTLPLFPFPFLVLSFYFQLFSITQNVTWVRVTTVWRVLWLRKEEAASKYGGQLRIYLIISRRKPTKSDPTISGLGEGLTTHDRKERQLLMECYTELFGTTYSM
jgi:hypothetical protein